MDSIIVKCILMVSLFLVTFLVSLFPMVMIGIFKHHIPTDERTKMRYLAIGSALSCTCVGVFLGLAYGDLLPDSMVEINNFPAGSFMIGVGCLLMMVMNQLIIIIKEYYEGESSPENLLNRPNRQTVVHQEEESISLLVEGNYPVFFTVVLAVTLIFHSCLEGFVIGMNDDDTEIFSRFLAIMCHKVLVAFGLGFTSMKSSMSKCSAFMLLVTFSLASPLGIGFAILLIDVMVVNHKVNILLTAVSCGSFFYVICFEFLPLEMGNARFRLLKILFIIIGFSIMTVYFLVVRVYLKVNT